MARGVTPGREESGAGRGKPRRPRRSREQVSRALIDAASALFAERPSGRVTVRDIAARADVNPGLVHRYFGTKQDLMRAAMAQSQNAIAANLARMADVRRDLDVLYRATVGEREFVAVLARASLDGTLPDFPAGYPTMAGLVQRIQTEIAAGTPASGRDPRVIVACLGSLTLGYALIGRFIRRGTGLEDMPDERLDAAIIDVLREIAGLAFGEAPS